MRFGIVELSAPTARQEPTTDWREEPAMADGHTEHVEPAILTDSIDEYATGVWQITTATGSIYVLDLDQRLLTRVPELVAMRRDHEPLQLHRLIEARVGASGRFLVQVRTDDIPTIRLTSTIVAIRQLRGVEGAHDLGGAV